MSWREIEAPLHFNEMADQARSVGAQLINGAVESDLVLITAEEYQKLKDGTTASDPLLDPGPPYFDDLEIPERRIWPRREQLDLDFDE